MFLVDDKPRKERIRIWVNHLKLGDARAIEADQRIGFRQVKHLILPSPHLGFDTATIDNA